MQDYEQNFNDMLMKLKKFEASFQAYSYSENIHFFEKLIADINTYEAINAKAQDYNVENMMIIINGAIGSGKSTLLHNLIEFFDLEQLPIISPELYMYKFNPNLEYIEAYNKTKDLITDLMDSIASKGKSLIIETVLAKDSKLEFIKKCKKWGYYIIGVYIETPNCEINMGRISKRIDQGGYPIPNDKVRDRFNKCKEYLPEFINLADDMYIVENFGDMLKIKFYKYKDKVVD